MNNKKNPVINFYETEIALICGHRVLLPAERYGGIRF